MVVVVAAAASGDGGGSIWRLQQLRHALNTSLTEISEARSWCTDCERQPRVGHCCRSPPGLSPPSFKNSSKAEAA